GVIDKWRNLYYHMTRRGRGRPYPARSKTRNRLPQANLSSKGGKQGPMKLKRILSLALSGVLAVSMLTACGGGGISNILNDRSNTVRSALNGAQEMLSYKASDRNLDDAISTVAESLTATQVTNGLADNNVANAVR